MIRRVAIVLAALLVSVSTGTAPAGAVSGGTPVPDGLWPFVAKVNVGTARACTGAMVGPRWIVTATSCFAVNGQSVTTGAPGLATTATVGRAGLSGTAGQTIPVVHIVPHPTRDVLLAKLALRVTDIAPITVSGVAPAVGNPLRVAGYGRTATEWVPDRLRAAPAVVDAVAADSFGWAWTAPDGSKATVCQGDAGGPVFRVSGSQPELVGLNIAGGQDGCLAEPDDSSSSATAVRVDDLRDWIARNAAEPTTSFQAYLSSSTGIGGYDLASTADRVVPFDYDHSGKLDHLLVYRPGSRIAFVVKRGTGNTFTPVYSTDTGGIGGYDLADARDQVVAFDYDHSGKSDHLLLYRPGTGVVWIVKHGAGNTFTPVFQSGTGIGGYDLANTADRIVPFDYDHSGKLDHLLLYRPGRNTAFVVKHGEGASFSLLYSTETAGIGGYDLANARDQVIAFDYEGTGKLDHLLMYRPGSRTVFIVKHGAGNTFSLVYSTETEGIGGYDLADVRDRVVAFDYEGTGKLDHLVLYRPGSRTAFVVKHGVGGSFTPVYTTDIHGIGGYDLADDGDQVVAFDYDRSGGQNHLVLYRPGGGIAWIVGRQEPVGAAPVTVRPADRPDSIVERFGYPGAEEILRTLGVRLISGDGRILIADCATAPVNNVGVVKVYTTEQIGPNGGGVVCFRVAGPVGRLDLQVPGVYEIRGDGQRPGHGHQLTAVVTTEGGQPTPVVVNPSGSTQVGIGIDPSNEPTTLLQLRVPA